MSNKILTSIIPHPRHEGRGRFACLALTLLIAIVTFSSCATTQYYTHPLEQDYNNTYMYWTKENIIEEFGKPVSITTDADGLETLRYERLPEVNKHQTPSLEKQYLEFHLDANSRCTQVKSNYTELVAQRFRSKPTKKGIIWGSIGTGILVIEAIVLILTQ